MDFYDLDLNDQVLDALDDMNFTECTPIQEHAIPVILQGRDLIGVAQTGTGKTAAFLLPILSKLSDGGYDENVINCVIMSPTRELAQQIDQALEGFSYYMNISNVAIYGGNDGIRYEQEKRGLTMGADIIIATPGRLISHLSLGNVDLSKVSFFVLDEADRMLDMGFIDDMRRIAAVLPVPRQTLLFSATLPPEIQTLAREFLHQPARVQIGSVVSPADTVLQEIVYLGVREKLPQLLHELNTRQGSILIFTRTKHGAERLAKQLKLYGQKANALHGELRQNRRRQVLEFFRSGTVRVLVATDLAARGIDVPHIAYVINYDLPQCPEDYIHRIGRTGRAGMVGTALSFISDDGEKWKDICRVTRFSMPVKTIQKTIEPLPAPKFVAQEEGAAHAKNRRKTREKTLSRPSKATELAKRLLAQGTVDLPQRTETEQRPRPEGATKPAGKTAPVSKKSAERTTSARPKTFQKALETRPVLAEAENPFRTVKVGASKKKIKQYQSQKERSAVPTRSNGKKKKIQRPFAKFFKRKRR